MTGTLELYPPGLVWAMRGRSDGVAVELPVDAAVERPCDGWLWLHFSLTDIRTCSHIQSMSEVPPQARSVLCEMDEFQQLHIEGAFTYGMVADVCRTIGGATDDFGFLHFAVAEHLVITARRRQLSAVDMTRRILRSGHKVPTGTALLAEILDKQVDGLDELASRLTLDIDRSEDNILEGAIADERRGLGRLRRTTVQLHRHLFGLRLVLGRLERDGRTSLIATDLLQMVQVILPRVDQLERELIAVRERARLLQEEIAALLAEETNRHLRVLSILTILFMPPTFVAGLFGMNLKGMAFAESELGFWSGTALAVASSVAVVWIMKRMGVFGKLDPD